MADRNEDREFSQRNFEEPGIFFRFCMSVIHPMITGPGLFKPFVEGLGLKGNERVLELGCGNGVFMYYLARALDKGGSAVGVDTSSYMTGKARRRLENFKNVEIIQTDIRSSSLEPGSFDLVTFIHVLHDIAPRHRGETVSALAGLLRTGGRLCLMEPVSPSHGIPEQEIRSIVSDAGLTVTESVPMGRRVKISCVK